MAGEGDGGDGGGGEEGGAETLWGRHRVSNAFGSPSDAIGRVLQSGRLMPINRHTSFPPLRDNTENESTENDGSSASCCSDRGVIDGHPERHKQQHYLSGRSLSDILHAWTARRVASSGRTASSIPQTPSPAPNRRENVVFMDHQKMEPPNSTVQQLRKLHLVLS